MGVLWEGGGRSAMSPISNVTVQPVMRERDLRLFDRVDQISLRNLIQGGWTIEQLCDLIIDRDPGLDLQRQEILEFEVLRAEWLFARRVERQNQQVLVRLEEILGVIREGLEWAELAARQYAEKGQPAGQAPVHAAISPKPPLQAVRPSESLSGAAGKPSAGTRPEVSRGKKP